MDIKILVVDDDEQIANSLNNILRKKGFDVDVCYDGDKALEQFYNKNYHLVILDIMLPGINGHELLRELRKIQDTPVLMITALDDDDNQLRAFNGEVDDYVTKPFSVQILIKRAEALLRRSGVLKKEICVGEFVLYPESYKVYFNGADIQTTPKEFELLLFLVQNKGRVITHETLITKIWGYDFEGTENTVQAHMKNLRNKIPANIITTIKGVGYRLEDAK